MHGMWESWEGPTGHILSNFSISRITIRCSEVSGASCATYLICIIFHVKNTLDEVGFKCTQKNGQGIFWSEIPGYSLFTTMQCDICTILLLTGIRGKGNKQDFFKLA